MMNKMIEAVKEVIKYEFERGQELFEMVMDGYNGVLEAYTADYAGDYATEETEDGIVVMVEHTGEKWLVTDSLVTKDADLHVYEIMNDSDETILKTTDEAKAYNMTINDDSLVYFEDGKLVSW